MNFFDLIRTANHNLFKSKTRTFLTILAVFIGSFTIILSNAINAGVNDFIDKQVQSIGGDGFIEVFPAAMYDQVAGTMGGNTEKVKEYNQQTGAALSSSISDEDIEKLRKVDGVKTLEIFHMLSTEWMKLKGAEKSYDVSMEYFPAGTINIDLSAGRMTDDITTDQYEIIINEDWLKPFGLNSADEALNKTVEIAIKQPAKCYITPNDCLAVVEAKIVGVQAPGVLTMDGDLHINKALDQKLYDLSIVNVPKENQKNFIAVGDIDPEKTEEIREAFKKTGSGFDFITVADAVSMIRTFFDVILVVFNIFGGIALIAASIGIINTLFMSVQERTKEIGLEKALGMSKAKIFLSFSLEAILLGFWGSILGIVVSMALGFAANDIAHQSFLADFPTFQLAVFNPLNMLTITAVIMTIAFIAGTAPALRASKKDPIEALRYE